MIKLLNRICIGWQSEYKFHPKRKWRFDFANPVLKIAIEQEGGVWISGRHNRGKGFLNDMEKYNQAVILGWKVLRYPPDKLMQSIIDIKILNKEWLLLQF